MSDNKIKKISLTSQLVELHKIANNKGFYEAEDYLKNVIGYEKPSKQCKQFEDMKQLISKAYYVDKSPVYYEKKYKGWIEYRFTTKHFNSNHKSIMEQFGWSIGEIRKFYLNFKYNIFVGHKDSYCFFYVPNLFSENV